MLRVLSATGLTASAYLAQPNVGYKWKFIYAQITITTGTGTGTRSGSLQIVGKDSLFSYPVLAAIGNETGTSAIYGASGGTAGANSSDSNTSWSAYPEMRAVDECQYALALISGDTASYYVLVDEVLDE